jgi:hypothetical protein
MNLPSFAAEASLYRAKQYYAPYTFNQETGSIFPSWLTCGTFTAGELTCSYCVGGIRIPFFGYRDFEIMFCS